jgi:hypothetical protein
VADLARAALEGVDQPAVLAESLAQVTRNLDKGQLP